MTYDLIEYVPRYARELVEMWRASFERAVGIIDPHPIEEQVRYLEEIVVPENDVVLVIDSETSAVVAFMASTPEKVSQLYVRLDHQRMGIGSMLLDRAKRKSPGRLRLFTFERNEGAQRFYERHGFRVIARGFEKMWQLEDIEYEWVGSGLRSERGGN